MEDIFNKIIGIDNRAKQILEGVNEDKTALENEFEEKTNILAEDIEQKKEKKLSELIKEENKKKDAEIAAVNKSLKEQKSLLEERCRNGKKAWTKQIFDEIFG